MRKESCSVLAAAAVSAVLGLAGCGTDLGECDRTMLGGSEDVAMPVPHAAQVLVNASCAGGLCHSASAEGDQRRGAPAELNFDVLPASTAFEEIARVMDGAAIVQNRAEDMWALIDSGEMPPPKPEGGGEMSSADKETVRNWLACGAPVIATPAAGGGDPFSRIYTAISGMNCQGCHQPGLNMGSFLPMVGDPCTAYDNLVGAMASGPACGTTGAVLVQPNMPESSLLLQKLRATPAPPCGDTMPRDMPPLEETNEALVQMIEDWITAGAPEPAECR
jgi:hypothetical protein